MALHMYTVTATALGKRFNREWIFANLSITLHQGDSLAILGKNGSGKSTLLQCIAGSMEPTTGEVAITHNNQPIPAADAYQVVGIVAPYLELVEEFTTTEMLQFHGKFKTIKAGFTVQSILEALGFTTIAHKPIKQFSSGMKQRMKLALAFYFDNPLLLLDEPCSNLDVQGIQWYQQLCQQFAHQHIFMVGSNDVAEYAFCKQQLNIQQFK
jgi:ABC-type multidrug transport system ATPase subunit